MNTNARLITAATMAAALLFASVAGAADVTWQNAGTDDWNVDDNWLNIDGDMFVPEAAFDDAPVIANGGTAFLSEPALGNDDPFPSVTVSDGGLEIRDGGSLETVALNVGPAGSLSLAGTSAFTVTEDASTTGGVRIEGPNVDFSVGGDYTVGGTFHAVVTGDQHSAVQVGGAANVSGTLRPEFNGVTPQLGDSWPLIDADSVVGTFNNVDTSAVPPLGAGTIYSAAVNAGEGNVNLVVTNTLELVIQRRTGQATARNVVGDPLNIDSYTISSPSGLLDPSDGAWSSLADSGNLGEGWTEGASNADAITESKTGDPASIAVGSPVELGNPVVPTNFAPEDAQFSFSAGGVALPGLVTYEGVPFNLVLNVDPDTGAAEISNQATIPIEFDGYAIFSSGGALQVDDGSWSSLEDSGGGGGGWLEANPTANALAELNPENTTMLAPSESLSLGTIVDPSANQDLTFQFFLAGGSPDLRNGFVGYGLEFGAGNPLDCNGDGAVTINDTLCATPATLADTLAAANLIQGDIDADGNVGFPDFLVLSANFGGQGTYLDGDLDLTGDIGFPDFLILSGNFGQSAGAAAAAVPEPASLGLLAVGMSLLVASRRRR